METVLIIEDEKDLAEMIAFNLRGEGYRPILAADGTSGLAIAQSQVPQLILLDLMLPGLMGTEICKILKRHEKTAAIPVIMLTARGEEIDRVVGFEVGADDYMVKPFSIRELLLRIKAVLRRHRAVPGPCILNIGSVSINQEQHTVNIEGAAVVLTTTEFKLLCTLAERRNRVQSRETLLQDVWGYNYTGDTRTVDTHVTRLRTKLGDAGEMIKTIRGFGYKMEAP